MSDTIATVLETAVFQTDVACNLCGSHDRRILPRAANGEMAALREQWRCTFVECRDCGLRFYSPRLDEGFAIRTFLENRDAELEARNMFETGVFFGEPEGGAEAQKALLAQLYAGVFDRIADAYFTANGRWPTSMFEVGTSVGWFSKAAIARAIDRWGGLQATAGCDANTYSARYAREGNGLNVQGCIFSQYDVAPDQVGRYDLIVAYDFLEHTYTPRADLEKLHGMTAPGGLLAVKTFVDELDPDGAMIHPVFHHHHFTLLSLRDIIEQTGWKIVEFDARSEAVYAQVTVFAQKV